MSDNTPGSTPADKATARLNARVHEAAVKASQESIADRRERLALPSRPVFRPAKIAFRVWRTVWPDIPLLYAAQYIAGFLLGMFNPAQSFGRSNAVVSFLIDKFPIVHYFTQFLATWLYDPFIGYLHALYLPLNLLVSHVSPHAVLYAAGHGDDYIVGGVVGLLALYGVIFDTLDQSYRYLRLRAERDLYGTYFGSKPDSPQV